MKRSFATNLVLAILMFLTFIIYTVCVKNIDLSNVGANNSIVGFSFINSSFHKWTGVNFIIYNITDWCGLVPIFIGIFYGFVGLIQLLKRKSLFKVDGNILALGLFYILVFSFYIFFEYVVINRRPILINGYLEASYPSSTTMLTLCFIITSIDQTNNYIKNEKLKSILNVISICFIAFMLIGRTFCGVHWLTDIVGGVILSISLIYFYNFVKLLITVKQRSCNKI